MNCGSLHFVILLDAPWAFPYASRENIKEVFMVAFKHVDEQTLIEIDKPEDLPQKDLARLVMDMFYRIMVHHTLWFSEAEHQFGLEKALDMMKIAKENSCRIQLDRLAKVLGFELQDGVPRVLLDMPKDSLVELMNNVAVNWLANDGVWFQAVEFTRDMNDAKRCNDSCWTRYSPFEARSIKEFLGLPKQAGLEGLKRALKFRMYARINVQSITEEGPDSFIFQMNDCRVQSARKKKGLADYPCKSVGLVEYGTFAEAVDSRIHCECIGCPPDEHPTNWFCAWRFSIPADAHELRT
jgi:hypothetical protein